jgi:hypothetical protein
MNVVTRKIALNLCIPHFTPNTNDDVLHFKSYHHQFDEIKYKLTSVFISISKVQLNYFKNLDLKTRFLFD